uniref:PK-1 n=1 Tax=Buzura suppressaria nuclear polyhedrosis virus TaxID=74320 RepID=A0A0N7CTI2_NPVBS|nr:PK-1 [Buzura suppressaria nucleopolyhedrovirus]QYF10531.1 protein kinase 1 [Buzura suppressaria nucleopolyhedrovirus]
MDMFNSEFTDFQKQFVLQPQYNLTDGKFGKVSVYKHEPTQKELLVKYIKSKYFNPIEPYVHYLMKNNKFFVKLYYSINWLSGHLLIMDFVKQGDLFDVINTRTLSEDEVKLIVCQLVDALNALHVNNLIHNDVKLENILYRDNGQIVLCDYGLCQHIGIKSIYNGTLDYFSPEKINHGPYDTHFDWWAVGIVTYELLTKQNHPFKTNNIENLNISKLKLRQKEQVLFYNYNMSVKAKKFIYQLLNYNLHNRLVTYKEIKQHDFLKCNIY